MKNLRLLSIALSLVLLLSSCRLFHNVFGNMFKPKYGCPSNGKNVGAEKILSGDPKAMKDVKKAKSQLAICLSLRDITPVFMSEVLVMLTHFYKNFIKKHMVI